MKKILTFMLIVACCLQTANAQKKVIDSKTTYAHDALAKYVENGSLPGAISIFYRDGVQETCCIGYADVAAKRKITLNDIYMQCSQTKGFCGVTVAKLIEEGKLSLDDPVSKYLPEFETLWVRDEKTDSTMTLHKARNVLTVRMVLNHTGGFPFETAAKSSKVRGGGWSGGAPLRQNACVAAACPLRSEPGTKVRYSNTGIDIAAAIVEVVTGMKWEDYLKKEVLDPLGMKSSSFKPTDKQLKKKVEMYRTEKGKVAQWKEEDPQQQRPYNDSHVFASAGAGLWTTAKDQLKFYKMLMNLGVGDNGVRILKEETVKNLLCVSSRPEGMEGYSLGLTAPVVDSEDAWVGHGGAWGTNCNFNWHTRCLRLFVVQLAPNSQEWREEWKDAADKFFNQVIDDSGTNAYTGRVR